MREVSLKETLKWWKPVNYSDKIHRDLRNIQRNFLHDIRKLRGTQETEVKQRGSGPGIKIRHLLQMIYWMWSQIIEEKQIVKKGRDIFYLKKRSWNLHVPLLYFLLTIKIASLSLCFTVYKVLIFVTYILCLNFIITPRCWGLTNTTPCPMHTWASDTNIVSSALYDVSVS